MKFFICVVSVLANLLIIQAGSAAPGDIIWQQTLGGAAGEEWGYSLDSTADGGILVTGIVYSADGNVTGAQGNGDLWVVRLNPSGEQLWNRAFGGNESDYGLSVKSTADGGSVIIGTTGSNSGSITGYHGLGDILVLRLSASGDPLWQKVYGGNRTDEGGDILPASDGGFILTGYTMSDDGDASGHHGGGDLWMVRLDQNGAVLWQKAFGGSKRDSGSSIIQTSDGGYAMCGNSYSVDGDVTTSHGSSDLWVIKTDVQGNLLWQKTFGGSKLDWGHSIAELPGGDLMVAGVTASSDGDVSLNHGAGDIWVIRLTADSRMVWEKTFGGNFSDNVWKMDVSPSGGVYLSGETFSVDGDFTGIHGDADLWVAEIDGNGTLLWYRLLGGQFYESGSWLKLMPDGNLTVCGTTRSADGDVTGSRGEGDLWVVKVDPTGVFVPVVIPVQNVTLMANTTQPIQPAPVVVSNNTGSVPVATSLDSNTSGVIAIPVQNLTQVNTTETMPMPPAMKGENTTNVSAIISTNTTPPSLSGIVAIPGLNLTPTDPDGDGQYEDLNGNGKIDLQDSTVFFSYYDWIIEHFPPLSCDYNGNGGLDFSDVNALFKEASG